MTNKQNNSNEKIIWESQTMEQKILQWYATWDVGNSSETMVSIVMWTNRHIDRPYDPADFNRCYELVQAVPEIKDNFDKIKQASKQREFIITNWDLMVSMLLEERQTGTCRKLYDYMQQLDKL